MGPTIAEFDAVSVEIRPTWGGPVIKEHNPQGLKAPGVKAPVRTVLPQHKYIYCNTFAYHVIKW